MADTAHLELGTRARSFVLHQGGAAPGGALDDRTVEEVLATLDQRELWAAAEAAKRADEAYASAAGSTPVAPTDTARLEEVDARHAAVEAASDRLQRTVTRTYWLIALSIVATVAAVLLVGPAGLGLLVIAAAGLVLWALARRRVRRAARAEERALDEVGATSYLGFQLRRVDELRAEDERRRSLEDLGEARGQALAAWQAVAGDISVDWALVHRPAIAAILSEQLHEEPRQDAPRLVHPVTDEPQAEDAPVGDPGEMAEAPPEGPPAGPVPSADDLSVLHVHDRHTALNLSSDDLLGMYRTILTARVLDQKIWALNRMGKAAFVVSGQGHEGAQVGSAWALRAGHDIVLPYYRDTAVMLTLGMSVEQILLAVLARADDPNSGARQMPNHWGWPEGNVITGSSPIATQLPHAAGLAYAAKLRREDTVVVSYFGEGATSKGDFHEALNFAGIHQLPMVFVCENNGYAISVPMSSESAVDNVADRAHAYGFGGVIVDGNDPLDVFAAVHSAVRHARRGDGPTLVECKTYRYLAHTSDDDDRTYRTPQEVEAWRKKDPLRRITQYLIEQRLLSEADEERIEAEVKATVDAGAKAAEAAAAPAPASAYDRVYARPLRALPGVPEGTSGVPAPPAAEPMPTATTERNVVDAIRWTQQRLLASDDRVVVLGEDVGPRGGVFRATDGLAAEFGAGRVVDTPLAESSIIGIGIGLALADLRPIAEIQFADFIHSGFDQLVSEAARIHYRSNGGFNVPLVVRAPWGGGVHGALYHSQSIEATYAHIPGLKVVVPSTPADVAGMLRAAVDDPDPVLFLEHKKTYRLITGPVPDDDGWRVPIGLAEVARPGDDLTVVTYGLHRHLCLEAAELLADEDGSSVEVIDLRTISPLDRETVLASVARTGRCLVVHEDNISFGVGAEVAAIVAAEGFWDLDAPVRRLATADVPSYPFAAPLEAELFVDTPKIVDAMRSLLAV
jgi:2-oxoisovalerate dehydrogenase E1 component